MCIVSKSYLLAPSSRFRNSWKMPSPEEGYTLPPGLKGSKRALLKVGSDSLMLTTTSLTSCPPMPLGVYVLFWGQDPSHLHAISPPVSLRTLQNQFVQQKSVRRTISYKVVTHPQRFKSYLKDAGKLILEVRDAQDGVVGYSFLHGMEKVVDLGTLHQNLDIFSPDGTEIGQLSCYLNYRSLSPNSSASPIPESLGLRNKRPSYRVPKRSPPVMQGHKSLKIGKRSKSVSFADGEKTQQGQLEEALTRSPKIISWNLSTQRLKFIAMINQFRVDVRKFEMKPDLVAALNHFPGTNAKRRATSASCGGSQTERKNSYFVSYSIPPEVAVNNFCSSKKFKRTGENKSNVVQFQDAKSVHSVRFDSSLLDIWWTSNLEFKVLARSLNQKTPTFLGSGFVGLKHILMDESCGEVRLPVYSSTSFRRSVNQSDFPEIIGDLDVCFSLCNLKKKDVETRNVIPAEKEADVSEEPPASANEVERPVPQITTTTSESLVPCKPKPSCRTLICLLRVSEGSFFSGNYCKNCSCSTNCNVYVLSRLFSRENPATSKPCSVSTGGQVQFNLQHSAPFPAQEYFLEKFCKDNFLVVEVWRERSSSSHDDLIGISTVSLHPFYEAFRDETKLEMVKTLDLPVIAANEWLPVTDVECGTPRGELRVLLAAGIESQIQRLTFAVNGGDKQSEDKNVGTCEGEVNKEDDVGNAETDVVELDSANGSQGSNEKDTNSLRLVVRVDEGRNLPRISSFGGGNVQKFLPNTYITILHHQKDGSKSRLPTSRVVDNDRHPRWEMECVFDCPSHLLTDPRRHLIVKVWHKPTEGTSDHVLGFGAVDLTPLIRDDFKCVSGWYNVIDFVGKTRGQIKVDVRPEVTAENVRMLRSLRRDHVKNLAAERQETISTGEVSNENSILSEQQREEQAGTFWIPPDLPTSSVTHDSRSVLADKLSDLEALSNHLKGRLEFDERSQPPTSSTDGETLTPDSIQNVISTQLDTMKRNLLKGLNWSDNNPSELGEDPESRMEPDGGNPSLMSDK